MSALANLKQLEDDLWEAADELRANSNLPYNEFFLPVMGILFLRHAANRFTTVEADIQADRASGKLKRAPVPADYIKRRSLFLPETARYDQLLATAKDRHLGEAVDAAMAVIEESFPPLKGILPKGYSKVDAKLLEDVMKIFNRESLRTASGDVFGRIYEYFLRQFAMKKAHDDGEFFTPPSLVQLLVNITEPGLTPPFDPAHGVIVADLACGSCGMFVQTSHFVEDLGGLVAHKIVFYGQEKTATTIQLAKMNLAVHGLEGHIAEANTYYDDPHTLVGRCDRMLANPPFNVDKIDATKVESDKRRLPFGLPGVNKEGRVSNGNYVWISYFYSYLNPQGRAGFVMSAQASSAGNDEKTVRRKLVETGHVDVMVAIRGGFFYTRTVPCELWFFDKNKRAAGSPRPSDGRVVRSEGKQPRALNDHDHVLMLDARHVHRQVNRTVYDFSPEQLHNLSAIVWLYRGERDRFIQLLHRYQDQAGGGLAELHHTMAAFHMDPGVDRLKTSLRHLNDYLRNLPDDADVVPADKQAFADQLRSIEGQLHEMSAAGDRLHATINTLRSRLDCNVNLPSKLPQVLREVQDNLPRMEPVADAVRAFMRQVDEYWKGLNNALDHAETKLAARRSKAWKELKVRDGLAEHAARRERAHAEAHQFDYFRRQLGWLLHRFPDAEFCDVPGLCKAATRAEIEAADWSLTPGRYVGVAAVEEDEDFDFDETMRGIDTAVEDLNREAVKLAKTIHQNFTALGL